MEEVVMADDWFYVIKGSRKGPVALSVLTDLILKKDLGPEDFVWKKGFDTWKRIKETNELAAVEADVAPVALEVTPSHDFPSVITSKKILLSDLPSVGKKIYIRIGKDRGGQPVEYGPYELSVIKKLFNENRINGKSEIFTPEMSEWTFLADFEDFKSFFGAEPPPIVDIDRRQAIRKPFKARLFIQNNKTVYEGICRDISIGGMQVLLHDFPGKAGDKISINVHPDNSDYHFVAAGQIVRFLNGQQGFSFRFTNLTEEARSSIEKYIHDSDHG
jgi:hypothetical protein